ncbi:NAD-dependent epimerase/dehydratase family protein [Aurantiacibacter marinus]|uniref:NAD-dependent epimerase/dehydratase family protein n=1 Tax=Aurantiacibacter marinus TaxID=874156 RepID=UPI00138DE62C|nr:NAD-dependent epimerase/dehydratase family protein [Aurantiacibacter marinus]
MTLGPILITGATGGLGTALRAEASARGAHIRATSRSVHSAPDAQFVSIDLASEQSDLGALMEGRETVIHSAALSDSWGDSAAFESINVEATRRLLCAAREEGVRRFVFISSPSIFARLEDQVGIDEASQPAFPPLNHYARTKLAAERLVLAAGDAQMATCAIRPRALVGEGDRVILPRLIEIARRRRVPLPRGGRALIELTDLRDAAWAICEAAERCVVINGKAINISGGRPIAVRDLTQSVADILGTSPKLVDLPAAPAHLLATVLEKGARLLGTKEPPLTLYTLSTMGYSQTFDLGPAYRLLGYTPQYDATQTILDEVRKSIGKAPR